MLDDDLRSAVIREHVRTLTGHGMEPAQKVPAGDDELEQLVEVLAGGELADLRDFGPAAPLGNGGDDRDTSGTSDARTHAFLEKNAQIATASGAVGQRFESSVARQKRS